MFENFGALEGLILGGKLLDLQGLKVLWFRLDPQCAPQQCLRSTMRWHLGHSRQGVRPRWEYPRVGAALDPEA
jgi:hypothetical protein